MVMVRVQLTKVTYGKEEGVWVQLTKVTYGKEEGVWVQLTKVTYGKKWVRVWEISHLPYLSSSWLQRNNY